MERGFYHSSRGYWQTTGEVPDFILDAYPEGTIEVSVKPSGEHEWADGEWVLTQSPPAPITSDDVNMERDRRMNGGFVFQGVKFQSEAESKARILGAAQLAFMALAGGASPTSLRWHGGASDFSWIAEDNSIVTMTAPTVIAFGQAAAQWETAHLFHARAIKAMNPIPANYADDAYWPVLWPAA